MGWWFQSVTMFSCLSVPPPPKKKRNDDLKEMLESNKESLKLEAMKRIVGVSGAGPVVSEGGRGGVSNSQRRGSEPGRKC